MKQAQLPAWCETHTHHSPFYFTPQLSVDAGNLDLRLPNFLHYEEINVCSS